MQADVFTIFHHLLYQFPLPITHVGILILWDLMKAIKYSQYVASSGFLISRFEAGNHKRMACR